MSNENWTLPPKSKLGVRIAGTIKRSDILARLGEPEPPPPTFWQKIKNSLRRSK